MTSGQVPGVPASVRHSASPGGRAQEEPLSQPLRPAANMGKYAFLLIFHGSKVKLSKIENVQRVTMGKYAVIYHFYSFFTGQK